jgi:hypothetical protein
MRVVSRLTSTLDADTYSRLSKHARRDKTTRASLARGILRESIAHREKLASLRKLGDVVSERGLRARFHEHVIRAAVALCEVTSTDSRHHRDHRGHPASHRACPQTLRTRRADPDLVSLPSWCPAPTRQRGTSLAISTSTPRSWPRKTERLTAREADQALFYPGS